MNSISEKDLNTPSTTESSTESMDTTDSTTSVGGVGEGGDTGEVDQNKSVVFATLEVCLCALVRQIPAMNPSAPTTGFQTPTHLRKLSDEACQLISTVVTTMADIVSLCSPLGMMIIVHINH